MKQKYKRYYYQLGRNIQRYRKYRKLTQQELADRVGVSHSYIGKIEIGIGKPSLELLYKIADVLEVKVKDLFPF